MSLRVQTVLRERRFADLDRSIESLSRAVEVAALRGRAITAELVCGEHSGTSIADGGGVDFGPWRRAGALPIERRFFDEDPGVAGIHNRLFADCHADLLLLMEPGVVLAPDCLFELLKPLSSPGTGIVEARELPVEDPKDYDPITGETGWATATCALIPSQVIRELGGFDAESFFLDGEDTDFSWRARLAGYRVICQPSAAVFVDRRVASPATRAPPNVARLSAAAALSLAHKWSRPDLVVNLLAEYESSAVESARLAAELFLRRRREGRLCPPLDPDHRVGQFVDGAFAPSRFVRALVAGERSDDSWFQPRAEPARPFLSVITRTQGRRVGALRDALLALAAQSSTDFEVLVIGHRLNSERRRAVEQLISECSGGFRARVRLLLLDEGGRAAPLNLGFAEARGRYIAALDDDDVPFGHWVETFDRLAEHHPGRVLRAVSVGQLVDEVQVATGGTSARAVGPITHHYPDQFHFVRHLGANETPNHAVAFPRSAFHDFGQRFDETITVAEDWDFLMRVVFFCDIACTTEVTCVYRWWRNAENSRTAQGQEEWEECQRRIWKKFDQLQIVLGPGAASRLVDGPSREDE